MQYNTLNIKVRQDTRRQIECWCFSHQEITNKQVDQLTAAHYDTLDMFLNRQPILVVPNKKNNHNGTGWVSKTSQLVKSIALTPPYDLFLLNTHALNIIKGKTVTEKIAQLSYLKAQKEICIQWICELEQKGLYTVIAL